MTWPATCKSSLGGIVPDGTITLSFAGITLDGATLRPDKDDNRKLYGAGVSQAEILHGNVPPPPSADPLYAELNLYALPK